MRVAIIGRTEILYDTALQLKDAGHEVVCILTAKEAPEYARTANDFRALANLWNIPFAQGPKIGEYVDFLRAAEADIAVSINYTGVVPQSVINIFPHGVLNAHGGDLPRYRGNACQAWAILNGEVRIGLCIHKMIGGELDSGDIIAREYLAIDHHTKVGRVWEWIALRTPVLMAQAVERISEDPSYILEQQSKDPKAALRCYPRRPEDGRIDWNKPAIDVLRLINASNKPYSGAFCQLDGEELTIWEAKLVDDGEVYSAVPGQVTKITEQSVHVACGVGKIEICEVESANKVNKPNFLIKSIRTRLA